MPVTTHADPIAAMGERGEVRYANTSIPYHVTRSKRRKKTIEITVDGQAGVLVAAPLLVPRSEIEAFVRRRAPWILRKASGETLRGAPRRFVSGESVLYLGRRVEMVITEDPIPHAELGFRHWSLDIRVPGGLSGDDRRSAIREVLMHWYRERAASRLSDRTEYWARVLGRRPTRVLVRGQKRRWASCAQDGTLRFNWRIVMAEPALMDYVIVHELVHLGVKNHSREFWTEVARAIPDHRRRRERLREVGSTLSI